MTKLLTAAAVLVALIAPAHANFTVHGVLNELMSGIQTPTCSQYLKWVKANPKKRGILQEWLLGFRNGMESQMAYEPEYDKATGSEISEDAFLGFVNALCKDLPKTQLLAAVQANVDYFLKESIKHSNPRYNPGFNVYGILKRSTCQNLIMEVDGQMTSNKYAAKTPAPSERRFLLEEWMLGVATGIEARVLWGKPMSQITKATPEELLDAVYGTCRANPTDYVFRVVHDQELANIEAVNSNASSSLGDTDRPQSAVALPVGHGDPWPAAQTTPAERSDPPPSPAHANAAANRGDGTTPAGPAAPGTGPVDVSQPISPTTPGMPGTSFVPGGPPVGQYATVPGALPADQFRPGTAETLASAPLRSARSSF